MSITLWLGVEVEADPEKVEEVGETGDANGYDSSGVESSCWVKFCDCWDCSRLDKLVLRCLRGLRGVVLGRASLRSSAMDFLFVDEPLRKDIRELKEWLEFKRLLRGGAEAGGVFEFWIVSRREDGPWLMVTSVGPEMFRRPLPLLLFLLNTLIA